MIRGRRGIRNHTGKAGNPRSDRGYDWRGRRPDDTYGDAAEQRERQHLDWVETPARHKQRSAPRQRDAFSSRTSASAQEAAACPACWIELPATGICDTCAD